MDENESLGADPSEQFHRNEAISAVADDAFLGEEDDDYEDLYNDVNVGENFLQSLGGNEDNLEQRNQGVQESKADTAPTPTPVAPSSPAPPQQQPPVQSGGVALQDEGASSRVPGRVEGYQNMEFRGNSNTSDAGAGRGAGPPAGSGGGFRVELGKPSSKAADLEERAANAVLNNEQVVHPPPQQQTHPGNMGSAENARNVNGTGGNVYGGDGGGGVTGAGGDGGIGGGGGGAGSGGGGGGTILFVGDLHWWTTDAELESELCKYGPVKEVKFFDERASGKSKGYCQVEFFDPAAATACKERMNGHVFNGRSCVVAYASPYTVKRMGEAQVNRNQQQMGPAAVNQPRRGPGDLPGKPGGVGSNLSGAGNHPVGGDNNGRGFGRGNWGRGNNQGGMGNRGPIGPMRNRGAGGMGVRGLSGNGFGQGIGPAAPLMHPQAMMGQGFDPAFGGPMGRMGGYGGFPGGPAAPFSGILPSFGPVGNVGLPGVAPHVNPAFFGRGMPMNGMGMMPNPGIEGPNIGMWPDPSMGGWVGDEHGGRAGESSYGEEAASDHQYRDGSQERGPWPNAAKEKDRGSERDWSGSSERRYKDDGGAGYERDAPREKDVGRDNEWSERRNREEKDLGRDRQRERERERDRERSLDHERGGRERERERNKDDRDRYASHHRHRSRDAEYDDEWDRGRSSRTHGKSRVSHEEERRSRSRDADYGKRRRLVSD
ncbi:RNA-binding protein [Striga asiatica]|uniref:RNA-binding protein n=1 Tax=Striga asiatica TaxID=4170 RepID=A0A5A7PKK4_STRAF|nr:RNA-binding protein [Striga asiatica]